ncbi:Protease, Ulp1 family [Pseudoloma neurophilia]|uniref:Protease, Ulp1 family n=1 Tax=Pseudoloma neurophilia TaxID=146866 RepID=A0A0R0M000_9MICR|nr:Protease, Ulp1 family [Pseudoloma neurophilia]
MSINKDSLKILMSQEWFDNFIIDDYLQLIEAWSKQKGQSIRCLPCHYFTVAENLKKYNTSFYERDAFSNIFENKFIMMPANYQNKHWAISVVDVGAKTIYTYDSIKNSVDFMSITVKKMIESLWNYQQKSKVIFSVKKFEHTMYQKDSFNCGLYVCLFARWWIERDKFSEFYIKNKQEKRLQILIELHLDKLIYAW